MPEKELYAVDTPTGVTYIGERNHVNTENSPFSLMFVAIFNTQEIKKAQKPGELYTSTAKRLWEQKKMRGVVVNFGSLERNTVHPLSNLDQD